MAYPKKFILDKVEHFTDLRHVVEYSERTYGDLPYFTQKIAGKDVVFSFKEYAALVRKLGTAFSRTGIMGGTAAILAETRYEWGASYLAIACGGGIVVPLDKELAPEQIKNFLERSKADTVVYSKTYAKLIEDYARESSMLTHCVSLDLTEEEADRTEYKDYGIVSFAGLVKLGEKALAEECKTFTGHKIDNNAPCAYLFTSGTTGTSKVVMLSHKNIASNIYSAAASVDLKAGDTVVAVLPAHHTYETTCTFFSTWALGVNIIANESLKTVMNYFKQYKPTKLVLVPLFVDNMVKKINEEIRKKGKEKTVKKALALSGTLRKVGLDLRRKLFKDILGAFGGNIDGIICGGAPLNPEHIKLFDGFGVKIWQGYGITECSPLVAVVPEDMWMKKCGSAGHPVPGTDVKIDEPGEDGIGEILAKGDNVMLGYYGDEEATKATFADGGWFRTGDYGYIDKDGYIYVTGRKKNIIILSNGKNIYPEEIEEYLYKIDLIKECAVIERKRDGREIIAALIFPDIDRFTDNSGNVADSVAIKKQIQEAVDKINVSLPVFKQITEVDVLDQEFEKTSSKKIIRYKLK
ncbi:long-chain-fatty-acid--CoA ligase [Clostridia bacterium]|nr:long-chain-fatty-acid--CoA ligase [Clostridia bacterium]